MKYTLFVILALIVVSQAPPVEYWFAKPGNLGCECEKVGWDTGDYTEADCKAKCTWAKDTSGSLPCNCILKNWGEYATKVLCMN